MNRIFIEWGWWWDRIGSNFMRKLKDFNKNLIKLRRKNFHLNR
jgi:hypothetical protein